MSETILVEQNEQKNSYDAVPYESVPYPHSNPSYLRCVGSFFGMNPPKLENARVLELGCAGGGNIIPIAHRYPKSECVGVDLSAVQIDIAKKQVEGLGLKNIEFKCASITDIDASYGKFDYIICHGVFSWVPENVQDAILKVCGNSLTENGLAYISYNTLPGWNMVRTVRDMMLYHSSMFSSPIEKVQQSRLLLDFIKDSLPKENNPYAEVLRRESEILAQQPDHYLFHDHLEEYNKQYYFNEFMKEAAKHSLQYVGDSAIASMFLGNLPSSVVEKLQAVNDIIRTEQYMDFINNRRFRMSILSRAGVRINRDLNDNTIKSSHMYLRIVPEKPISDIKIEDLTEQAHFLYQGIADNKISTTSPVMKAVLYTFAENMNHPLSFDDIVKLAAKKLPKTNVDEIAREFAANGIRMVLSGHINLSDGAISKNTLSKKPEISGLARYQALNMPNLWVTNELHERVLINILEKYLLRYLDGKHSVEELVEKMITHVESGELTINKEGKPISDKDEIKKEIHGAVVQTLEKIKSMALLVA